MATQMYKGSLGKHDWAVGDHSEDGYLVFVDDRPLSYRNTIEDAIGLAFHFIARLKADGDYRLNDKPAGFYVPELTTLRLAFQSLAELYVLWDVFMNVETTESFHGLYTDAPFLYFRKSTEVGEIVRWFENRNSRFIAEDVMKGKRVIDATELEADFDLTVFRKEEGFPEKKPLVMPKSLIGRIEIATDAFGDIRAGLSINDFFIVDPTRSECGRSEVEPSEYGLTQDEADFLADLNALIEQATAAALNAGCLTVQNTVGVDSGDLAGIFFSAAADKEAIANKFAQYILAELRERAAAA